MSRVRSRDTKPELVVRSTLHSMGYRYVLHSRDLPGHPDLVFPSRKMIVFVHGCFWHGHRCKYGLAQPKTNVGFWKDKISTNATRDRRHVRVLRRHGWKVKMIWECEIKKNSWIEKTVRFLGPPRSSQRVDRQRPRSKHAS